MSKYQYLRDLLQEAYPLYLTPKMTDEIMRRIEEIRDTEKQKESS
jgi:hypothetical protein